jgi:hypothetical protein
MGHIVDKIALKSPAPGTERFLIVHRFGTPGARPKVYLQAALHADEWPGLMALNHLIPMLDHADKAGRIVGEIVLVPYANPIGLDQRLGGAMPGRYAADGAGNFNRNWPDLSAAAATHMPQGFVGDVDQDIATLREALKKAVAGLTTRTDIDHWRAQLLGLSIDADYVIDVHCDQESQAHLYCHLSHVDIAKRMAAAGDIPVVLLEEEAGGFSFDDCNAGIWRRMAGLVANAEGLPMACYGCTLELRGKDDVNDAFGQKDAAGLVQFMIAEGVILGDASDLKGPEPYRLDEVDVIYSETGGLIAYKAEIGEYVEEGQLIAEIIDITAPDPLTARTPLYSQTEGLFFARIDLRLIPAGEGVAKVAGRKPLAHRRKGALLEA